MWAQSHKQSKIQPINISKKHSPSLHFDIKAKRDETKSEQVGECWIWDIRFVRESLYLENTDKQWYCELMNQVWSPQDPVLNLQELSSRVFKFYTDGKNTPTKSIKLQ